MHTNFDFSPLSLLWQVPGLAILWVIAVFVTTAIIHIGFALAILQDAQRMTHIERRGTFLVGGYIWALAVLLGGVVPAGIYWAVHHSNLRPVPPAETP